MNERNLIDALVGRAAADAKRFREQNGDAEPNERWLDNSYTAALPLAKDQSGYDPGLGPHPHLFEIYRGEVARLLGIPVPREATEADRAEGTELVEEPTRGEG